MKPIWKSRTFWTNTIAAVLAGVEISGMSNVIPPEHDLAFVIGLAALNAVLRYMTTQPVRIK